MHLGVANTMANIRNKLVVESKAEVQGQKADQSV